MAKYKLTWKDLKFDDFKTYLFAMFKAFIPKKKIKNLDELEQFIQTKSAWVTQVTLYNYLKTRMGTRYVPVSYTHLRAHETDSYLVCRLLLEKKNYCIWRETME